MKNPFKRKPDPPPEMKVLVRAETKYNDIMVIQNGSFRDLWFVRNNDFFLQSRINTKDPQELVLVYSKMTLGNLLFQPEPKHILVVGLGGAVLTNCLHDWYPEACIDVVEIDKEIINVAKKCFFLRESKQYKVHEADGRVFIQNQRGREKYDFVILDAFKSGSIPYHLKTVEFYGEIRDILAPGGVVSSNLYGKSNELKPRDSVTFASVFKQTYLFNDPEDIATVLHAADHEQRWSRVDLERSAMKIAGLKKIPLDMREVAAMYRPEKSETNSVGVFFDNFPSQEFLQVVDKNNENLFVERPYPIKSGS
ncbi:MAG: hypothetical protein A3K09_06220 [Nitrospinae bacterium RIFCSPLOWO2_12_FULL_47_7]|nr:MAG: hypothetical protein A3K09_06220 [Nitrospinae bacterium RIFCSPLOWO2_12_FULL_47_7]